MKRRRTISVLAMALCAVIVVLSIPMHASAFQLAPSVQITLDSLGDEPCYATILESTYDTVSSNQESSANNVDNETEGDSGTLEYDIRKAFADYVDEDGFFYQNYYKVVEAGEVMCNCIWDDFKLLLYFPESDTMAVSNICSRYAMESRYTIDMDGVQIPPENGSSVVKLTAYRSYGYLLPTIKLLARVLIAVIIEMLIAVLFGYTRKKQILLLVGVNTFALLVLNLLISRTIYYGGFYEAVTVLEYSSLEVVVTVIEAVIFGIFLNRLGKPNKVGTSWRLPVVYTLVSNVTSYAVMIRLTFYIDLYT